MTISSTTRKAGPFDGNNVTTAFPFTFKVFSESDVVVVKTDPDDIETTLTLTTHYTVSLNADQDASPGGTVTLPSALPTNYKLTLTSDVPTLQAVELANLGGFYPAVINAALDRLTIFCQELAEELARSVKVPISSTTDPDALVASVTVSEAAAAASAAAAAASAAAAAAAVPSGALGYTPVNIVGDTMTGTLNLPAINVNGSGAITSLGNAATKTTGAAYGNVPLVGTKSATETLAGLVELATQAEAEDGADNTVALTALRVKQAIAALAVRAGAAVASTSGTAIDFIGIPAGTKRITVMFSGVSTSGISNPIVQLGNSGGFETTGYLGSVSGVTGTVGGTNYTDGVGLQNTHTATGVMHGCIQFSLLNSATFLWAAAGTIGRSDTNYTNMIGSSKALTATLDRIRITTQGGTDTFDAGSINILYE